MPDPTFSELTDKERAWVQDQLDAVPPFIDAYSPEDSGQAITLAALDRAFAAWLAQDIQDITQVNAVINLVGIRFGQFLVDEAGFQWVIATDRNGTDLAILALPGEADMLVYPANFVSKRWERRESGFLAGMFEIFRTEVEKIEARPQRPWWRFW